MPCAIGDKIGHYEVLSLLGQGGMGEVYKARDNTLKREVALKVLPASFLRDPERMARFQREAEVLASLDHPNIGPIYGLVDSADSRTLVLALIGRPADRRSDIFSFGAVLFEMLCGQRAFNGATAPDVLEAVVKTDPDWSKLPACEALMRRCLTKDRKQRLQAIGEARIALNSPLPSRDREE